LHFEVKTTVHAYMYVHACWGGQAGQQVVLHDVKLEDMHGCSVHSGRNPCMCMILAVMVVLDMRLTIYYIVHMQQHASQSSLDGTNVCVAERWLSRLKDMTSYACMYSCTE
jgi:hypothetical protein